MDRVFLDANVLFSAAYRPVNELSKLWELSDAELLTSAYAIDEARRNLTGAERLALLNRLIQSLSVVPEAATSLPPDIVLPAKDLPILSAASRAAATHLLTGDRKHFGRYHGHTVAGVLILSPRAYLQAAGLYYFDD